MSDSIKQLLQVSETIKEHYPVGADVCKQAAAFIHWKTLELDKVRLDNQRLREALLRLSYLTDNPILRRLNRIAKEALAQQGVDD